MVGAEAAIFFAVPSFSSMKRESSTLYLCVRYYYEDIYALRPQYLRTSGKITIT